MKVLKKKHGCLIVISLFLMIAGLMFVPTKVMAHTTHGDVAMKMAELLGFKVETAEEALWALQAVGITLDGELNMSTTATTDFIGNLYFAVNHAINQGTLIPPSTLGNASTLVAAAATAAGMASAAVVEAIVATGGDRASASHGASYFNVRPNHDSMVGNPTPSGPSGGAGGGGGGVTSPSS